MLKVGTSTNTFTIKSILRHYAGPLLFVLDEAPLQHKILNFGLFQAKTYANGL